MDNAIADHLVGLAAAVGLEDVTVTPQPEHAGRGDADFASRAGIWAEVATTRGHQMVADGAVTESLRSRAERDYRQWVRDDAQSQTMYLLADRFTSGGATPLPPTTPHRCHAPALSSNSLRRQAGARTASMRDVACMRS